MKYIRPRIIKTRNIQHEDENVRVIVMMTSSPRVATILRSLPRSRRIFPPSLKMSIRKMINFDGNENQNAEGNVIWLSHVGCSSV